MQKNREKARGDRAGKEKVWKGKHLRVPTEGRNGHRMVALPPHRGPLVPNKSCDFTQSPTQSVPTLCGGRLRPHFLGRDTEAGALIRAAQGSEGGHTLATDHSAIRPSCSSRAPSSFGHPAPLTGHIRGVPDPGLAAHNKTRTPGPGPRGPSLTRSQLHRLQRPGRPLRGGRGAAGPRPLTVIQGSPGTTRISFGPRVGPVREAGVLSPLHR